MKQLPQVFLIELESRLRPQTHSRPILPFTHTDPDPDGVTEGLQVNLNLQG